MSPTVEAWFAARGMRLTPAGELVVTAAAGLAMLVLAWVTVVALVLVGAGVGA